MLSLNVFSANEKIRIIHNWGYTITYSENELGVVTDVYGASGTGVNIKFTNNEGTTAERVDKIFREVYWKVRGVVENWDLTGIS